MHIVHQHPFPSECQQNRTDLQALYRSCLLALQRYRHPHIALSLGAVRPK